MSLKANICPSHKTNNAENVFIWWRHHKILGLVYQQLDIKGQLSTSDCLSDPYQYQSVQSYKGGNGITAYALGEVTLYFTLDDIQRKRYSVLNVDARIVRKTLTSLTENIHGLSINRINRMRWHRQMDKHRLPSVIFSTVTVQFCPESEYNGGHMHASI